VISWVVSVAVEVAVVVALALNRVMIYKLK
jgi:hypothetical protein